MGGSSGEQGSTNLKKAFIEHRKPLLYSSALYDPSHALLKLRQLRPFEAHAFLKRKLAVLWFAQVLTLALKNPSRNPRN